MSFSPFFEKPLFFYCFKPCSTSFYNFRHFHTTASFSSSSRNSSNVFSLRPSRLARSTSSSALYNESFTYAFCWSVLASSAVGSSSFPASHSRSFLFNAIPWIYVHRLFSYIVVIILTCLGLRLQIYKLLSNRTLMIT